MRTQLTPEAQGDLAEAHAWHLEKGGGAAEGFLRSAASCMASIDQHPEAYPVIHGHVRRAIMRRFPYGMYYVPGGTSIYIHAVVHSMREPTLWFTRIPTPDQINGYVGELRTALDQAGYQPASRRLLGIQGAIFTTGSEWLDHLEKASRDILENYEVPNAIKEKIMRLLAMIFLRR